MPNVRALFTGLLLAMLLAALDSTIVATALPTIVAELGEVERLSWVVTAYLLSQTILIPVYGKLGISVDGGMSCRVAELVPPRAVGGG